MAVLFLNNMAFCCNGLLTYQFCVDEKTFSIGVPISREKKINILLLRPQIISFQINLVCNHLYLALKIYPVLPGNSLLSFSVYCSRTLSLLIL